MMRINNNNQPYDCRRVTERNNANVEATPTSEEQRPQRSRKGVDHFQMSGDRPRSPQRLGPQSSQTDYSQAVFSATANQVSGNEGMGRGARMAPPDPAQMLTNLDTDGSGGLSVDEFLTGMPSNTSQSVDEDKASELFNRIDSDGDGNLTQEELEAGRPQPPQGRIARVERQAFDPEQFLKNLDSDGDGKLSVDELKALMSQNEEQQA